MKFSLRYILSLLIFVSTVFLSATLSADDEGFVAVINMDMMILPGTQAYLDKSIKQAEEEGAKLLIIELDTPGGILNTSQEMVQHILSAPVPVVIYVSPSGGTATSAGVFITLAGHVAAMAPGTSIGAAHPVAGDGKDIEGDMRQKAEQMTIAMVKSIAEQRGRNVEWAEKSVKESNSLTEKEALSKGVVDLVAEDVEDLLKQISGKKVKVQNKSVTLGDYSKLSIKRYQIHFKDKAVNVLANPNIAALLWLAATTGISIELYNPGLIFPGVVGLICLILALAVSQIIPISQGGVLLIIVGAALIAGEFFVTSGILGVGGIIAIVIGSLSLVDVAQAPGLSVSYEVIAPIALMLGGFMLFCVTTAVKSFKKQVSTGNEGLIGMQGRATENVAKEGRVFVNGEIWRAVSKSGLIEKDAKVYVTAVLENLTLQVERVESDSDSNE